MNYKTGANFFVSEPKTTAASGIISRIVILGKNHNVGTDTVNSSIVQRCRVYPASTPGMPVRELAPLAKRIILGGKTQPRQTQNTRQYKRNSKQFKVHYKYLP